MMALNVFEERPFKCW